jgi:hypothetical protein
MLNQASGVLEAHHGPAGRAVDLSGAAREPLGRGRYSGARLDFVFRSHIVSEYGEHAEGGFEDIGARCGWLMGA